MRPNKRRWFALASLIAIILGLAGGIVYLYECCLPESVAEIGRPLPSLTLRDLRRNPVKLEIYRGKPLLLSFVQIDCHHCQNQLETLETLQREIPGNTFLIISTSPLRKTVSFFEKKPVSFPVWIDEGRNLYKKLGVFNVPALFVLDGNGILYHKAVGYQSSIAVRRIFENLKISVEE